MKYRPRYESKAGFGGEEEAEPFFGRAIAPREKHEAELFFADLMGWKPAGLFQRDDTRFGEAGRGCQYEPGERAAAAASRGFVQNLFAGPRLKESSALLYDFAVDSSRIKPAHEEYLAKLVRDRDLRNPASAGRIALIEGFSDCVGPEQINSPLRAQRAESVAFRLSQLGIAQDNLGENRGAASGELPGDDSTRIGRSRNRGVIVLVEDRPPVPAPDTKVPSPGFCPGSTRFDVQLLGSVGISKSSGSPSPAAGLLRFAINDLDCNRGQRFILKSAGVSGGLAVSASTTPSAVKRFRTSRPVVFRDFEGAGLWESIAAAAGAGGWTFDGLAIPGLIMSWFSSGSGSIGLGASILVGEVTRDGRDFATGSGSRPHPR